MQKQLVGLLGIIASVALSLTLGSHTSNTSVNPNEVQSTTGAVVDLHLGNHTEPETLSQENLSLAINNRQATPSVSPIPITTNPSPSPTSAPPASSPAASTNPVQASASPTVLPSPSGSQNNSQVAGATTQTETQNSTQTDALLTLPTVSINLGDSLGVSLH